jgi:ATP-dependent helicase/nuclease subunit B
MGSCRQEEIGAWLRQGGIVVAASERAARALTLDFHRARRAEGLIAWPAPRILDWQGLVRQAWEERAADGRLILNSLQEQAIWEQIIAAGGELELSLAEPLHRVAGLAADAHALLALYAPQYLRPTARDGWLQDAAAFSRWLAAFGDTCRAQNLISTARLPLELTRILAETPEERPPLLVAAFDRMQPAQRELFSAWGAWREITVGETAPGLQFYQAPDAQSELAACARWCSLRLATNPKAKLLIITQDLASRRGEMERAFLRCGSPDEPLFEFSLGVPLMATAPARAAYLILRWLTTALEEHEIDWLISSAQSADYEESLALAARMRAVRQRGRQRPEWTLGAFLRQAVEPPLPAAWAQRMTNAENRLNAVKASRQTLIAWTGTVSDLLEAAGWPGPRPRSSAEFQVLTRFQQVLDACASLGFDGRRIPWSEFLAALGRALNETLFTPESTDAPIQIVGPAESAGLTADAAWFLNASETKWPATGAANPFLPIGVQRDAGMPHASAQADWELAGAITRRLLVSAGEIHFSYPRLDGDAEARPSRIVTALAGPPQELPAELKQLPLSDPVTISFTDGSRIPFPAHATHGGSSLLSAQSQCPFQAFAGLRLNAKSWEPAEAGLTAAQRGNLLHAVMHSIWGDPQHGIRSHAELLARGDQLPAFVEEHVRRILPDALPEGACERMPKEYLELEAARLIRLLTAWLEFEAERVPFTVEMTEAKAHPTIAGLELRLRLDRIDRLCDGTLLVVDYKTGDVDAKVWELPRPEDVQLPLYACFGLDSAKEVGGLVFARVRTGDGKQDFAGNLKDARTTLLSNLNTNLAKKPLTEEQLCRWKERIEQLAEDFVAGRAEVDPRDYPETCKYCGLESLCRAGEQGSLTASEDESEETEASNG